MEETRRDFLKKSLKAGAAASVVVATSAVATKTTSDEMSSDGNGVVKGKSVKKERLYSKSKEWEYYYKIAY